MGMDITTAVNLAVLVSLLILAFSLAVLTYRVIPLMQQLQLTMVSIDKLCRTMDSEVKPTMIEMRQVMDGVNQIKSITAQRVQDVSQKAGELTGNVNTLVTSAKRESQVAGVGLLAGLKAYLFSNNDGNDGKKTEPKQIQLNGERKNVEPEH